ncbi:MAG: MATE family efflux transporter [Eubacterium sp.]|nr:MATE family efflux transporter [Eubacterium sp.]
MRLSLPAMLSQMTLILMQYIDASMVGRIGASASAAIGLVASTTWLFGSVATAATVGFTVQVAQQIGAGKDERARAILRLALGAIAVFSVILLLLGVLVAGRLPQWLGGEASILTDSHRYFLIYVLFLPVVSMNSLGAGMLRSSGNMRIPSILSVLMCVFDVIFNFFLIFPSRELLLFGDNIWVPGAGLGVAGAALGTGLAELVCACLMQYFLLVRSAKLHLRKDSATYDIAGYLKRGVRLSLPVCFENLIMCGAMVVTTRIVAPLGIVAIAANSFAVTAESLCYMPGYGLGDAAAVLTGQCVGAGNWPMTRSFGRLCAKLGMLVMAIMGIFMFLAAPFLIGILTTEAAVREAAVSVLRIEAFAEPLYGASIVISGALRGVGDTLIPSLMNFVSMWAVRLPLAYFLSLRFGLHGVWMAMCAELCFRGSIFMVRLYRERWLKQPVLK